MTEAAPKGRYLTAAPLDAGAIQAVADAWWPLDRLGEGLEELARRAGLGCPTGTAPPAAPASGEAELQDWIDLASAALGLEAEPVDSPAAEVAQMLSAAGPALVLVSIGRESGFVLLLNGRGGSLRALAPDLTVRSCPVDALRAALCWPLEGPIAPQLSPVVEATGLPLERRRQVMAALLRERLAGERVGGVWLLREPAGAPMTRQLARIGAPRRIASLLGVFSLVYGAEMLGWWLIGRSALDGRLDFGWLAAWLLLILTLAPLRFLGGSIEARTALDVGRMLKSRLMAGALRLDPDRVTGDGVGALIGRVMESQALESLALNGGLGVLVALLELAFAGFALGAGAAGAPHLILLAVFVAALGVAAARYHRRLRDWTLTRLAMTNRLIEAMVGHRTRLAQERPERRDAGEDRELKAYLDVSRALDRTAIGLMAGLPSAWLVLALAALAPAFASARPPSATALAISLGGVLLAQRGFFGVVSGLSGLSRAAIAWNQVSGIAGETEDGPEIPAFAPRRPARRDRPMLAARRLAFGYAGAPGPVFEGLDLSIAPGDRLLLEGESGGGKSTLTAILCGLREPTRGTLTLHGLDRHSLGSAWRAAATAAPQFHDNHVLAGTLAFNLLMGRRWPASPEDLAEADAVCRELGLGDLIDRMPAGLDQPVGETGWQLSHGERSRLFLARALLQGADLTVLDESFAALDPETLKTCLATASRHSNALMVVAHP